MAEALSEFTTNQLGSVLRLTTFQQDHVESPPVDLATPTSCIANTGLAEVSRFSAVVWGSTANWQAVNTQRRTHTNPLNATVGSPDPVIVGHLDTGVPVGGSSPVGIAGAVGVAALIWFGRRQTKLEYPLVDLRLFTEKVFTVAVITGVLSLFAWSAAAFLTGIYLQSVLGLTVLTAALLALPGAAVLTTTSVITPAIVERIGKCAALLVSHFSMAAGLALLLATTATHGIGWFIASTVVAGVGYGISFALVADTAVAAVPANRAGSAGAIAETSNEIGNALGIALLGSTAALIFRLMGPDVAPTLDETLNLGAPAEVLGHAREAFVTGLHVAVGVATALSIGLGLLALRWIPRDRADDSAR